MDVPPHFLVRVRGRGRQALEMYSEEHSGFVFWAEKSS